MSTSVASDRVLVVGAGPVGLVAACELVRRGVDVRVIDKLAEPTTESRALLVHARSLEMLDLMGVAERLLETGVLTHRMTMYAEGHELAVVGFDQVPSPYPYSLTTAQTETERVLDERLRELGAQVERGVELVALDQGADTVRATLRGSDGSVEATEFGWVVGADGAHSTVRGLVGTRLEGSFVGERFALGDVEARHDLDPASMYTFFAPQGPLLAFPMRGSRMRLIGQLHDDTHAGSLDDLQHIVDERARGITLTSAHWLTEFEIHHAQVPDYRHGRVFLMGDAAHVHSPAGGQGMNTGMQDAHNLAWKLALAVRAGGAERLLDSYHAERHPVAAKVIDVTTRMTTLGTLDGAVARRLRNLAVHAAAGLAPVQHVLSDQVEETALSYRGSPVVEDHGPRRGSVRAGDHAPYVANAGAADRLRAVQAATTEHVVLSFPGSTEEAVTVRPVDGSTSADDLVPDPGRALAAGYGLLHGGTAVIRPDGYLGYRGLSDADPAGYLAGLTR
ncbi:FAD-dependent monooxygenase [Nocardioides sp. GXQ0305]|uniref:FAD-dependent monooxygenase n=1 Tax=Nocardioides sp. GXQ0305 TaxID=3423912 RepID=UPI003D7DB1BB